ncbi:MAG: tetratricopeptide repeat protein [Candidatus Omnitrophica bacterium]|nr:tetratricopeptide repeat protein [Candidatus Omnitrophota bacterium]
MRGNPYLGRVWIYSLLIHLLLDHQVGKLDQALADYNAALSIDPKQETALFNKNLISNPL